MKPENETLPQKVDRIARRINNVILVLMILGMKIGIIFASK